MNHNDYIKSVLKGEFPKESIVPLDSPFVDGRGIIQNLMLHEVTSVASITSKRGTVRANHYHKTDWHYAFVISGKIAYYEREIGNLEIPDPVICNSGTMFFTPPMVEHSMLFLEDTVFITLAKNVRSHESHESDLVRVNFIDPKEMGF